MGRREPPAPLLLLAVGLGAVFSLVRLLACFDPLWLDEIWALQLVGSVSGPLGLLTELRTDNHLLYSVCILALGAEAPGFAYRLPAWLAGTGSLVLAWKIGRCWGAREASGGSARGADVQGLVSLLAVGASPLLVQFDAEARGYSMAVFFGLLAFLSRLRGHGRARERAAIGWWLGIVMGLLAHPIAVHLLVGGLAWSAWRVWRAAERGPALRGLVWWHAPPAVFATLFYLAYLRLLESGGAPHHDPLRVLGNLCALLVGIPRALGPALALPLALLTGVLALRRLARRGDDLWVFLVVTVWLSPLAMTLAGQPRFVFERYYLMSAAVGLLWGCWLLSSVALASRRGAWIAGAIGLTVLALDAAGLADLLRHGRGDYPAAIRYMAEHSPVAPVTVSSDHDFRNATVLAYHLARTPVERPLRYVPRKKLPPGGTRWRILHRREPGDVPPTQVRDDAGNTYTLEKTYPHSGVSGWHWYLYRNTRVGSGSGSEAGRHPRAAGRARTVRMAPAARPLRWRRARPA